MIIICCGINRSGSTWSYQVVKELLDTSNSFLDAGFVHPSEDDKLKSILADSSTYKLIKMHQYSDLLDGYKNQIKCIYTHRDLRGCIHSLMKKGGKTFENIINVPFLKGSINSFDHWKSYPILYVDFNDILNNSDKAVGQMNEFIGKPVNEKLVTAISENLRKENQIKRVNNYKKTLEGRFKSLKMKLRIENNAKEEKSLLHLNHFQSNDTFQWKKDLSIFQSDIIFENYKEWMEFFNYN